MNPLPLPIRVAAGLAAVAVEQVKRLPDSLTELPVTVASTAMQLSMRAQQHLTELAIKGDEVLATLRPPQEQPDWATFDEDFEDVADQPAAAYTGEPAIAGYDELSLTQVRSRLRELSVEQLEDVLAYEQAHAGRDEFIRMLTRRIATVRTS